MTLPQKELAVACNYILQLIKAHVELSAKQIDIFKRTFYDVLLKRFVGHWFPATPHRGSAYRCLQTKNWKDPVLRSIAERSCLPLHRYLPAIFTMWIDPGEVAVCFGDDGTWCPLYKHDIEGDTYQTYCDGEEFLSKFVNDDTLLNLIDNIKTLNIDNNENSTSIKTNVENCSTSLLTNGTCTLNSFLNANDWNAGQNNFWLNSQMSMPDGICRRNF